LIDHVDWVRRLRTAANNGPIVHAWVNVSVESHSDEDEDDDASWGKLLTRPPELYGNRTSRDIWERVGGMDEGVRISRISLFDTSTNL
jgi:hypothetical protein